MTRHRGIRLANVRAAVEVLSAERARHHLVFLAQDQEAQVVRMEQVKVVASRVAPWTKSAPVAGVEAGPGMGRSGCRPSRV